MTCPECGTIQARRNKCNRCSFNFETKEFEYELLSGKRVLSAATKGSLSGSNGRLQAQ
jgi:hypothetical protein